MVIHLFLTWMDVVPLFKMCLVSITQLIEDPSLILKSSRDLFVVTLIVMLFFKRYRQMS